MISILFKTVYAIFY